MKTSNKDKRIRRKMKIRKNLLGTTERPRVFLFKSNTRFYVGVADDDKQIVLASMMTDGKGAEKVEKLGKDFAKKLKELKVSAVVFDRSGYKYHGNVKLLADAIRAGGVEF